MEISEKIQNNLEAVVSPENQHESVALARALCPFAEEATDMTVLLAVAMVEAEGDLNAVLEYLCITKSTFSRHNQSPLLNRIIKQLTRKRLSGEGYLLGVTALMDVAGSKSQSGAARINAAKTLIELSDDEEAKDNSVGGSGKDLNEMTFAELEREVKQIRADIHSNPPPAPAITEGVGGKQSS